MLERIGRKMVQVLVEGSKVRVVHVRSSSARHRGVSMTVIDILLGCSTHSGKSRGSVWVMSLQVHAIRIGGSGRSRRETLLKIDKC